MKPAPDADEERGWAEISDADLATLARALDGERVADLSMRSLQSLGLGHLHAVPQLAADLPKPTAVRLLRLLLADRRHRARPSIELVWTGPEAGLRPTRDTAVLLRELFEKARRQVIVAGYSFDHGKEILRPLHRAMEAHDVEVHIFLNADRAPKHKTPEDHLRDVGIEFLSDNWPAPSPRPNLYAWPDTVTPKSRASLHAKSVVVDHRYALIGSANFTDRGLHRNIETGLLLDHPLSAERLAEQWLSLVDEGIMQRLD